jgi:hypothetical protein
MTPERERDDKVRDIDLTEMPRDVWDVVSNFLSLKDLKNLFQVNRVMVHRMRALMVSKYCFTVPGSLADFKALGWTRACLSIRLTTIESVFELSEHDIFMDIVLPASFNAPPENVSWPLRLTHLTFGRCFDQSVDRLPASLTHLTFGWSFNRPVDRLPTSLTHLTFGWSFNLPVDHLPPSLTHLTFGYWFSKPVDLFPASLKRINIFKGQVCLFTQQYRHLLAFSSCN